MKKAGASLPSAASTCEHDNHKGIIGATRPCILLQTTLAGAWAVLKGGVPKHGCVML